MGKPELATHRLGEAGGAAKKRKTDASWLVERVAKAMFDQCINKYSDDKKCPRKNRSASTCCCLSQFMCGKTFEELKEPLSQLALFKQKLEKDPKGNEAYNSFGNILSPNTRRGKGQQYPKYSIIGQGGSCSSQAWDAPLCCNGIAALLGPGTGPKFRIFRKQFLINDDGRGEEYEKVINNRILLSLVRWIITNEKKEGDEIATADEILTAYNSEWGATNQLTLDSMKNIYYKEVRDLLCSDDPDLFLRKAQTALRQATHDAIVDDQPFRTWFERHNINGILRRRCIGGNP